MGGRQHNPGQMDEKRPTNNDLLHHTQATAGGHFFYALGGAAY
jgi:hypothetical protein